MRVDRQQMLVSLAVLVYLGLGLYLSRVLVTWDDEGGYLALGRKLVTGELTSLFVDELSGHRMPLPFWQCAANSASPHRWNDPVQATVALRRSAEMTQLRSSEVEPVT